jgi:hypothetical protein
MQNYKIKNINRYLIFIPFLAIIIILFILFLNQKVEEKEFVVLNNKSADRLAEIRLPISYFSEKNIRHGSSDGKDGWERASLDEMTYQSYPTTSITLPKNAYSTDIRDLGNNKSLEEVIKENSVCGENKNEDCGYLDQIKENYNEYKELAPYYLPYSTISVKRFDVDGDGSDEIMVYGCSVGGNHCPHTVDIIKNNQIIFSVDGVNIADITPVQTGNGFYLDWYNDKDLEGGYCCPFGYVRTKFVYENNRFVPVLEQKVDYLRILDSLSYNDVLNSKIIDGNKYDYYKSQYEGEMVEWSGKISSYYSQITGIKFCIIDDEHQNVNINKPCDMFWAFSEDLMGADDLSVNPDWDGNWVPYILNYYNVPFDENADYFNDIYIVKGIVNGIDCTPSDKCSPDIDIISIRK